MTTEQKPNNFLCLYHKNCDDGFGAAFSFWKTQKQLDLIEFTEFIEIDYHEPLPDVKGKIVFIVDFSISQEKILEIIDDVHQLHILDHHKTAIETLHGIEKKLTKEQRKKFNLILDKSRSGTGITSDYFNLKRTTLIDCIESRDLYTFKHPSTEVVTAYLQLIPRTFEAWAKFEYEIQNVGREKDEIFKIGQSLIENHKNRVEAISKNARIIPFQISVRETVEVPIVNCPYDLVSDALNLLTKEKPFAVSYYDTSEHRKFSLRSTDAGLDVEKVAKFYGGGGHRNASAFKLLLTDPQAHSIVFPKI